MTAPTIVLAGVSHRYGGPTGEVVALEGLTLTVEEGEFVALVGPTGCGKSTTLRILAGLLAPSGGDARFRGEPVTAPQRAIGMVFQRPVLLPWKSVRDNLDAPARLSGNGAVRLTEERASALLALAGLEQHASAYPRELSPGMQQLLSFCMASALDPEVLLLDEPFGALDALTREEMGEVLLRICSRFTRTVVLVTHSIAEAVFLADRVIVLTPRPGRVTAVIDVPMPRPRSRDVVSSTCFAATTGAVRRALISDKEMSA